MRVDMISDGVEGVVHLRVNGRVVAEIEVAEHHVEDPLDEEDPSFSYISIDVTNFNIEGLSEPIHTALGTRDQVSYHIDEIPESSAIYAGWSEKACKCGCSCYYCERHHNAGDETCSFGHASYCALRNKYGSRWDPTPLTHP